MLKILIVILFVVVHVPTVRPDAPERLYREEWGYGLNNKHLFALTEHICKDAFYKLRLAEKVTEEYRKSFAFELGLLSAGIYDRFHYMTMIYRYYVTIKDFKEHVYTLEQTYDGLANMQGAYDQLRLETDLYYQVEEENRQKEQRENEAAARYAKKHGMSPAAIKKLLAKGIDPVKIDFSPSRRLMNIPYNATSNIKITKKPRRKSVSFKRNTKEEDEFKKKMRYVKWAEKWNGFNPETEGVHVPEWIARMGLANESNFLQKELQLV